MFSLPLLYALGGWRTLDAKESLDSFFLLRVSVLQRENDVKLGLGRFV
tara:strand:- start:27 stop:170 length:144 start_codon:yes stop_codon:yes gene_type:complete